MHVKHSAIELATDSREALYDITDEVRRAEGQSGIKNGLVSVYAQGATAGIMIQENWDESVSFLSFNCSRQKQIPIFYLLNSYLFTWGKPAEPVGFYNAIYQVKWPLVVGLLALLGFIVLRWFDREERGAWVETTWDFAKQILPLLFAGILVAGLLMGRPGSEAGLIPVRYIETLVGGNSLQANLAAAVVGAFMYFATLTEIPILQGLLGAGMGQGPALALLLRVRR